MALKLKWDRTWRDRSHDFCAYDPATGERVGRVQWHDTAAKGTAAWTWSGQGQHGTRLFTHRGREASKMEACERLEREWFEFKAEGGPETRKDPPSVS